MLGRKIQADELLEGQRQGMMLGCDTRRQKEVKGEEMDTPEKKEAEERLVVV